MGQPGNEGKTIVAAPGKLVDLVAYQEGAVVSREIVNKPTGTVTLFAFAERQGLSEHTAPFDALVHVLEGEVEITISGASHRVSTGEAIIMPAGLPHALKGLTRFKMLLVMIRSVTKSSRSGGDGRAKGRMRIADSCIAEDNLEKLATIPARITKPP